MLAHVANEAVAAIASGVVKIVPARCAWQQARETRASASVQQAKQTTEAKQTRASRRTRECGSDVGWPGRTANARNASLHRCANLLDSGRHPQWTRAQGSTRRRPFCAGGPTENKPHTVGHPVTSSRRAGALLGRRTSWRACRRERAEGNGRVLLLPLHCTTRCRQGTRASLLVAKGRRRRRRRQRPCRARWRRLPRPASMQTGMAST